MNTEKAYRQGSTFPPLEAGKLRIYSMRFCPFAQRARIMMLHKHIEFETVNINLYDKPDWFLKIAPIGSVPVIQKDDVIVYDSRIVCQYLDETFPGEKLIPSDPYQRAKDLMLVERFMKKNGTAVYKTYYNLTTDYLEDIMDSVRVLEDDLRLRDQPFYGGENPMYVDFIIWPHVELTLNLKHLFEEAIINSDTFPNMTVWIKNMKLIQAVRESICPENIVKELFQARKKGKDICDVGLEN